MARSFPPWRTPPRATMAGAPQSGQGKGGSSRPSTTCRAAASSLTELLLHALHLAGDGVLLVAAVVDLDERRDADGALAERMLVHASDDGQHGVEVALDDGPHRGELVLEPRVAQHPLHSRDVLRDAGRRGAERR